MTERRELTDHLYRCQYPDCRAPYEQNSVWHNTSKMRPGGHVHPWQPFPFTPPRYDAEVRRALVTLRGFFAGTPSGEFAICRTDGKPMGLLDQMNIENVMEQADAALKLAGE